MERCCISRHSDRAVGHFSCFFFHSPFHAAASFAAFAKREIQFTIPHARSSTQVSDERSEIGPLKSTEKILPYAVGPGSPTSPFLARRGGDPCAAAPGKPAFGFLGRNAAKRAQKTQTTLLPFPATITNHESLPSLTLGSASCRSNSRRLSHQLASRYNKRRTGSHGSDHRNV